MDKLQPIPQDQIKEGHAWRDWLFHLREKVNASALVGTGDQILSQVTLINQIADIVDTAFSVNTVGLYRIEYYLLDTTSDVTAGTVTLNIKYTDDAVARTISSTPIVLSATTGFTQGTIVVRLNSGNVTYGITHTGIYGASKYAIYLTQERLI